MDVEQILTKNFARIDLLRKKNEQSEVFFVTKSIRAKFCVKFEDLSMTFTEIPLDDRK